MKCVSHVLVALVAATLSAAVTWWLASPPGDDGLVDLEALKRSTPHDAAKRLMPPFSARLGERVVDMNVGFSTLSGEPENTGLPEFVSFRLRAKGVGQGVCAADNLTVSLGPPPRSPPTAGGKVAPDGQYHHFQTYRVIGDTSPEHDWSEQYQAVLDRQCAALDSDAEFFVFSGEEDLRALTDMLPALSQLAASPGNSLPQVRCVDSRDKCHGDPRLVLKTLRWERLFNVGSLVDCEERQTCLQIAVADEHIRDRIWTVRAKGHYSGAFPNGWGKIVLTSVELGSD